MENVEVALKAQGIPLPARQEQALGLLDRVGLDGFENACPRELSGGMRQAGPLDPQGAALGPGPRVGRQFFQDVLEWEFRQEEAEEQMGQAIDWGRYGERFGYAAAADQLFLEPQEQGA